MINEKTVDGRLATNETTNRNYFIKAVQIIIITLLIVGFYEFVGSAGYISLETV